MLLVFDFDGTLVDSLHDLAEAASDLSEQYGGRRLDDAAVSLMIGDGAGILVERTLATVGVHSPPPGALDRFLEIYDRRMLDHTAPYAGMVDTLGTLAPAHTLALLTNKPEAPSRRIMAHTGLDRYFSTGVFGDGTLPRKPDPAGLRWLMNRNGVQADRTLLIGDSNVDLETARAAGVRLAVASYGFGFARIDPAALRDTDLMLRQPVDLLTLIPGME